MKWLNVYLAERELSCFLYTLPMQQLSNYTIGMAFYVSKEHRIISPISLSDSAQPSLKLPGSVCG